MQSIENSFRHSINQSIALALRSAESTCLPFTKTGWALLINPTGVPAFEGRTVIVIWSPTLKVRFVHPARERTPGLFISTAQFLTLPFSSFTSTYRAACGLVKANSVTVPVNVTDLVES